MTFFVDEAQLREFSTGLSGEVLSEQNRVGRYLKFHSTNWGLMQRLVRPVDLANANRVGQYVERASGRPWGVVLLPQRSASGVPLGVIAVARDFSGTRAAAGRSLVWQGLLALFASVLLSVLVIVVQRGFLLSPLAMLSRRLAALAAGAEAQPVERVDVYCEEFQALAASYETLRLAAGNAPAPPRGDDEEGDQ